MFLQTISLAKTGYCPAGEVKYSFHVHNEGIGGMSDSRLTGFKVKLQSNSTYRYIIITCVTYFSIAININGTPFCYTVHDSFVLL